MPAPAASIALPTTGSPQVWAQLDATFGPDAVVNFVVHEYDQSIEIYFAASTPTSWLPTSDQLQSVCTLGFLSVYANFADDTEVVGGWKMRTDGGARVKDGDYWTVSPGRSKVGLPRYAKGIERRSVVLSGPDVELFREFLAWKRTQE